MLRIRHTKRHFPEFAPPLSPCNLAVERSTAPARDAASRRILVVRTGANGDILMGTPLLAALRRAWPDAHITWLVERRERETIEANPHVDEILLWETMYWKKMTRRGMYPLWAARILKLRELIQQRNFDVYISFQPEDWPNLTRFTGSAFRIGIFDTFREYHRHKTTSHRARLYTHPFTFDQHPPHRVDQYLLPLRALGLPEPTLEQKQLIIGYTDTDADDVRQYLRDELHGRRYIVVAPLTGWPSRVWPGERYAAVADRIHQRFGCEIVLVSGGGKKDVAAIQAVADQMCCRPHIAAGQFGLRALSAFIERAALVVSGDTGPMHIASAVGTPYVALFGPSPVERFAPLYGQGIALAHAVPCGPCHQYLCRNTGDDHQLCLKLITVEEVCRAAAHLMGEPLSPRIALPIFAEGNIYEEHHHLAREVAPV